MARIVSHHHDWRFSGFQGAAPEPVWKRECILTMLYLASERKKNLQVLMIWCLLAHSVATLLPWGCGGHYWFTDAGDTVNDELASLFIIDGALLGKLPLVQCGAWRRLALGSGFCFYYINRRQIVRLWFSLLLSPRNKAAHINIKHNLFIFYFIFILFSYFYYYFIVVMECIYLKIGKSNIFI